MTLDELRRAAPEGADVEAFLDALGVPHGGGLVPRHLVERALGLVEKTELEGEAPAVAIARSVFERAEIGVAGAELKRGWTLRLAAREPRRIFNELHEEDAKLWPAIELRVGELVEAKLYLASRRHLSAAHFLVSGLDRAEPNRLFIFVLVPDARVWMATAQQLRMLQHAHDEPLEAKTKLKTKFGRVGASKVGRNPVKVWFPIGNTSFDAEFQIRDVEGRHVLPIVARGGKARP
jgi:hypothetical protein